MPAEIDHLTSQIDDLERTIDSLSAQLAKAEEQRERLYDDLAALTASAGTVKYPDIEVDLTRCDSNSFALIGAVRIALRKHGVSTESITAFTNEALASASYDALLRFIMATVQVGESIEIHQEAAGL